MSLSPPSIISDKKPDYLYRSGVGIMLINSENKIFVGKRIDNNSNAWQMPQGGLDAGESEDEAMFRELLEETGISKESIEVIGKTKGHFYYNLPYKLQKKFWGGKYLGQKQRWYLAKFIGDEKTIDVATEIPEFSDWQWITKGEIVSVIVKFKRDLYHEIANEFSEFLENGN